MSRASLASSLVLMGEDRVVADAFVELAELAQEVHQAIDALARCRCVTDDVGPALEFVRDVEAAVRVSLELALDALLDFEPSVSHYERRELAGGLGNLRGSDVATPG